MSDAGRNVSSRRGVLPRRGGALLRNFVERASIPSFLVTLEGNFVYANQAGRELLGFNENELEGRDFRALVYPADLNGAREQTEQLLAGKISSFQTERISI